MNSWDELVKQTCIAVCKDMRLDPDTLVPVNSDGDTYYQWELYIEIVQQVLTVFIRNHLSNHSDLVNVRRCYMEMCNESKGVVSVD